VVERELEHDLAADGAAQHHGPIEPQRAAERHDQVDVGARGQPVLLVLPAHGRKRLAVPRHVEGEHAEVARDRLVEHQVAELAAVGAGGVQADERDALPGFLEVDAVGTAAERQVDVAADDRLDLRHHALRARGAVTTSFT
jgi:hypothetical protein